MESKELRRVYNLLSNELTKAQRKIVGIDRAIAHCDRLEREYWCSVRAEAVAFLNGLFKGWDIVWKELHK